ncbi:MAG: nitrous oxide reductase family maturation protein NosD [Candidatus Hodarchaeota archaeon]
MRNNQNLFYLLCFGVLLCFNALVLPLNGYSGENLEPQIFISTFQGFTFPFFSNTRIPPASAGFDSSFLLSSLQYIDHAPISINGNVDFLAQAATEGWAGTGTIQEPIMITNYNITYSAGYSTRTLIGIRNTDLCFQVCNNILMGASESAITYGISLANVTQGIFEIANNTVLNTDTSIKIVSSGSHVNLAGNNITNSDHGILIESSHSITLNDNIINKNSIGISLLGSKFITLSNNTLANNKIGASLKIIGGTFVSHNNIYNNDLGIKIHASALNITIQENNFVENNPSMVASQASDDGINNTFISNYWADWTNPDRDHNGIVDYPYPIDGEASNVDLLPQTASHNSVITEIPPIPRLLSNNLTGLIYNFLVFLSVILLVGISSFVILRVFLPKLVQRAWIYKISSSSPSDSTLPDDRQQINFIRVALSFNVLTTVSWYLLAAESTFFLTVITSSTLLTGSFQDDLIRLSLQAIFYLLIHPWFMIELVSALVISSTETAMWIFFLCLSFIHIIAAVIIKIARIKVFQPRIAKIISLDMQKVEEWINAGLISEEKVFSYAKKAKALLKKQKD